MIDFRRHIEIDDYLSGNLTAEEKAAFEVKLQNDTHLQEELQLQQATNLLVMSSEKNSLRNKLKDIHVAQQKQKAKKKKIIVIAAVSALATLLALSLLFFNKKDQVDVPQKEKKSSVLSKKEETKNTANNPQEISSDTTLTVQSESTTVKVPKVIKKTSPTVIEENPDEPTNSLSADTKMATDTDSTTILPEKTEPATPLGMNNPNSANNNDLCAETAKINTRLEVIGNACFGGTEMVELSIKSDFNAILLDYSINGDDFISIPDRIEVGVGNYTVIGRDINNCESKPATIKVDYADCNYVIRPSESRFLELSLLDVDLPIHFEVRNARSGLIEFQSTIEFPETFIYEGVNQNASTLPLGNYVYLFKTSAGSLISKGQIAVIE